MTDKMIELFEKLEGHYEEGIICDNETQIEKMWRIRESISLATAQYGLALKFDVSLGSQDFNDLVEKTQEHVGHDGIVIGHGHIGDGNLHLNCCIKGHDS
jgi:FAD/FMN-containing dehydrogenase